MEGFLRKSALQGVEVGYQVGRILIGCKNYELVFNNQYYSKEPSFSGTIIFLVMYAQSKPDLAAKGTFHVFGFLINWKFGKLGGAPK